MDIKIKELLDLILEMNVEQALGLICGLFLFWIFVVLVSSIIILIFVFCIHKYRNKKSNVL